ncbi:uncharacterized protein LOC141958215 [Athene noctua]|uniref:uncharacterized protein LOC141958215 n=1 Tax=Athene noctua TaxID=126797 RepID=UPI003EBEB032
MLSDLTRQTRRTYKMSCSQGEWHFSSTCLPRAMDLKVICVLSVILVVALSTLAEGKIPPTRCQCKMALKERRNCGYPGISEVECRKAGCCFNDSVPGMPWCFAPKPKKVRKVCPNDPHARINCGFPGIKAQECEKKGCCFNTQPAGVPWCFYHRVVEEGNLHKTSSPIPWKLLAGVLKEKLPSRTLRPLDLLQRETTAVDPKSDFIVCSSYDF